PPVEKVRREAASKGDVPAVGVALRVDGPTESQGSEVKVNCAERMHIRHAICCKLDFALTQEEVETGQVKWDLGRRPYYIRHGSNGGSTHNDRGNGFCGVYENRPSFCKTYTARMMEGSGRLSKKWNSTLNGSKRISPAHHVR